MTIKMQPRDYFTAADVIKNGPDRWELVRKAVRSMGYRVSNSFGVYNSITSSEYFVRLHADGDLVHESNTPSGRRCTVNEILGEEVQPGTVKIRVDYDKVSLRLAFDHLVGLGYSSQFEDSIMKAHERVVGLIGAAGDCIRMITTTNTFEITYKGIDEITYDIETVQVMTNISIKKKQVDVLGFLIEEETLLAYLKANATKSAALTALESL